MQFEKWATLICIFLLTNTGQSQMVFLGEDEVVKKQDGYVLKRLAGGLVKQGEKYFFTTPNGHFLETAGTAATTKTIAAIPGLEATFLAATNKYIYYSIPYNNTDVKKMLQYNPATQSFQSGEFYQPNSNRIFNLNSITVPFSKKTVDEAFVNDTKDKIFFRTFANDVFRIYALHDNAPKNLIIAKSGFMPTSGAPDVVIAVDSKIEFIRDEIFYDGRIKNPKVGQYEISISSIAPKEGSSSEYGFKSDYRLKEKNITINLPLLRTKNELYSLIQTTNDGKSTHKLLKYGPTSATTLSGALTNTSTDFKAEVLNQEIYITHKGLIFRYDEAANKYYDVFNDSNAVWSNLNEEHKLLKAGKYIMYKKGDVFGVVNEDTRISKTLRTPILIAEPNRYNAGSRYAYVGGSCFYFMENANDRPVFTQYNPETDAYKSINFPEFKKENFSEIKALFNLGEKFLLLTAYNRKDKPVYRMFMYTEEK